MQTNIIISGVGGQGVITLGMLISQTAMSQGDNVIMSEIHGLAQRGGSVSVDVRIGDFYAPIIPSGDVDSIIGLEPIEGQRVLPRAKKGTRVLLSSEKLVPVSLSIRHMEYPEIDGMIAKIAEDFDVSTVDAVSIAEKAGNYKAANVVILGFAIGKGWLQLNLKTLRAEISKVFTGKNLEINLRALDMGLESAYTVPEASK